MTNRRTATFKRRGSLATLALCIAPLLGGCGGLAAGAAGVGAGAVITSAVQERPIGAAVDDTKIKLGVNRRLLAYDGNVFANVGTEVVEGRVLLAGQVRQARQKVEAGQLVWQVPGVREVLNEIQVSPGSTLHHYATDVRISNQLQTRLLTDPYVRGVNYAVETVNGVVYLIGVAQSPQELERVVAHASTIYGVGQVNSHVLMKDDPRRLTAPLPASYRSYR